MPTRSDMLPGKKHAPSVIGRVLILGLGKSGIAVCDYLVEAGSRVEGITVYAGKADACSEESARSLEAAGIEVVSNEFEVRGHYDLCIASPGISQFSPFYQSAREACDELVGEVEFAWRESADDASWVAISGTNGKTTTTALAAHLLQEAGMRASAVGNIGDTCIEAVAAGATDIYVAELSSYQLASTALFTPNVAVLLNITPDHLSWHGSFEAYVKAKEKLFAHLGEAEPALAILDATDEETRRIVKRLKAADDDERGFDYVPIGAKAGLDVSMRKACGSTHAAYLEDTVLHVEFHGVDHVFCSTDELQVKGRHNVANALAAATVALAFGQPSDSISRALRSFKPLEHRIEPCGTIQGISCYNDSKATNVDAACKAFVAFGDDRPIALLGGFDKDTDLEALVACAAAHCKAVVCFGAAGKRFFEAFADAPVPRYLRQSLEDALDCALEAAEPGDAIVLSPACASFDAFDSFEHRGDTFKQIVKTRSLERGV